MADNNKSTDTRTTTKENDTMQTKTIERTLRQGTVVHLIGGSTTEADGLAAEAATSEKGNS